MFSSNYIFLFNFLLFFLSLKGLNVKIMTFDYNCILLLARLIAVICSQLKFCTIKSTTLFPRPCFIGNAINFEQTQGAILI